MDAKINEADRYTHLLNLFILQEQLVQMQHADEVECVVHGTYYASWPKINQQGLRKTSNNSLIPCYPFVPVGSKTYQLYIFLDVRRAMADGMKFFKVGQRQILCSGDMKGIIDPRYFSRVVDSETRSVIFPRPAMGLEAQPGRPPGGHWQPPHGSGQQPQVYFPPGAQVRGRGKSAGPPQGMELYQNIWSKVQSIDADRNVDVRPMQTQMLSALLNISGEGANVGSQQNNMGSSPRSVAQTLSNQGSATGRVEVSVQDIFNRAISGNTLQGNANPQTMQQGNRGETDILSMLNAAQQSYSNMQQNTHMQKESSPSKSAFVPTQVIRKQTPRKPKTDDNDSGSQEAASSPASTQQKEQHSYQPDQEHQMNEQTQQKNQPNANPNKPRGPTRNRLAVKFDYDQAPR